MFAVTSRLKYLKMEKAGVTSTNLGNGPFRMISLKHILKSAGFAFCMLIGLADAPASEEIHYADCMSCHKGIESISPNHPFACAACHLRPEDRRAETVSDHRAIVRNPSDPEHAGRFCGPCHENEIRQVSHSLHSTMAGIINQTRYLWGAQDRADPAVYGLTGALKSLPAPGPLISPETAAMLVDDFLRRRCLRCHIHTQGPQRRGLYRGTGCAACHVIYNDEGLYEGDDPAIDPSRNGYPVRHAFTTDIPDEQCLHCHNHNHVGADYKGFFERDFSEVYRSSRGNGKPSPLVYGMDHHRLSKDIHAERGLGCIDCHGRQDVMGDGRIYSFQTAVPKRTCSSCHGGFGGKTPDMSIPALWKEGKGFLFVSRMDGRAHRLPRFREDAAGHRIKAHSNVRCSACHAQWSYQDYGLSVMREDRIHDYKWGDLSVQGDPYLQEKLKGYALSPETAYPVSVDRISGEEKEGIWSMGWRFRRWEPMPLGLDHTGRYAILRPLYQYFVSHVDRAGHVPLDSVVPMRGDGTDRGWAFMPYIPHTIAPFGRTCTACHQNRLAAGLGIQDERTPDTALTIPSQPAIKSMRLMNHKEQEMLLKPTRQWHRERLRMRNPLKMD